MEYKWHFGCLYDTGSFIFYQKLVLLLCSVFIIIYTKELSSFVPPYAGSVDLNKLLKHLKCSACYIVLVYQAGYFIFSGFIRATSKKTFTFISGR